MLEWETLLTKELKGIPSLSKEHLSDALKKLPFNAWIEEVLSGNRYIVFISIGKMIFIVRIMSKSKYEIISVLGGKRRGKN